MGSVVCRLERVAEVHMKEHEDQQLDAGRTLARMVDFRLPLPWLLGGVGGFLVVVMNMWFSLGQLKSDMVELKASIAAGTATANQMTFLTFRVQTIEADIATLRGQHK
jgi:hypothetical protein